VYRHNGADLVVVDADSHVIEPPGAWDDEVPAAYRDRVPRLVTTEGTDWLELDGERFFSYAMMGGLVRGDPGLPDAAALTEARWRDVILPGAYDAGARLADMDRDGIDVAVIYPTVAMSLFSLKDRVLARVLAEGYNRWIAGFCAESPDRLKGVGVVLPDDAVTARAAIDLCHELGLVQLLVPLVSGGRDYRDPSWDPLFARAAELGLPIGAHAFAGRTARHAARSDTLTEALVDRTADIERALVALVFGGAFDRHPGLRFVSVENEAGWAASLIERAEVSYRRGRRTGEGLSGCGRPPGEVFTAHVFFTFIHDQTAIDARRVIGPANVLWSTDYPHNSSTWPRSLEHLAGQLRPELDIAEVSGMVGGNALALYGFDGGGDGV